jgi:hypothetical protein
VPSTVTALALGVFDLRRSLRATRVEILSPATRTIQPTPALPRRGWSATLARCARSAPLFPRAPHLSRAVLRASRGHVPRQLLRGRRCRTSSMQRRARRPRRYAARSIPMPTPASGLCHRTCGAKFCAKPGSSHAQPWSIMRTVIPRATRPRLALRLRSSLVPAPRPCRRPRRPRMSRAGQARHVSCKMPGAHAPSMGRKRPVAPTSRGSSVSRFARLLRSSAGTPQALPAAALTRPTGPPINVTPTA